MLQTRTRQTQKQSRQLMLNYRCARFFELLLTRMHTLLIQSHSAHGISLVNFERCARACAPNDLLLTIMIFNIASIFHYAVCITKQLLTLCSLHCLDFKRAPSRNRQPTHNELASNSCNDLICMCKENRRSCLWRPIFGKRTKNSGKCMRQRKKWIWKQRDLTEQQSQNNAFGCYQVGRAACSTHRHM